MSPSKKEGGIARLLIPAVTGSLIGQVMTHRGIPVPDDVTANTAVVVDIQNELTELGIRPAELAEMLVHVECALLAEEEISGRGIEHLTRLLWQTLGDPNNNGTEAPVIYRHTAQIVWFWFMAILNPAVIPND